MRVGIYKERKDLSIRVHELIAETFLGEKPYEDTEINHKDGVKSNNKLSNLEYTTPKENTQHALHLGLLPIGDRHYNTKISDKEVIMIFKLYKNGKSIENIAKEYNYNCKYIQRILTGGKRQHTVEKYNLN
jgi:hypothetical protein